MSGNSDVPISAISLIVDGLKRVEESITRLSADVHDQMSRLPELYVPRREVERRFDEQTVDIGELNVRIEAKRSRHDEDIKDLRSCLKQIETDREAESAQRQLDRRWLIGTVLTTIALLITFIGLVTQTLGS